MSHFRECQRRKSPSQRPPGLLRPILPAEIPFAEIGDLLGRFPLKTQGNRWIIVCTDYLTRFTVTKTLPSGEAVEIAKFLVEDVILKHGSPREIISDRGRSFLSNLVKEVNNLFMIYHLQTTAYHPQTNGLTERLNKTLADMLAMYVDVDQKNWDNILPFVTFAYNSTKQETTGFSPFFLVHGRDVDTPLDVILPFLPDESAYDYVQNLVTKAEEARQLAKIHLTKAQDKDKSRYDERHRTVSYKEGDLVWILHLFVRWGYLKSC
ncbi:Retrovirus-related Pol polyprotein from transposon 412 [Araneus ventricosus]|uniref:Retrovirus-related Pol polyprotein from transposon 412 n=1 Tax=Araneus ventricosus TaxID=182803 RepID=A0A4Y2DW17_ARAVE|nr:Retrovirus-related Pol polyprotein from transposon 412 [Araneus ventricosus]